MPGSLASLMISGTAHQRRTAAVCDDSACTARVLCCELLHDFLNKEPRWAAQHQEAGPPELVTGLIFEMRHCHCLLCYP